MGYQRSLTDDQVRLAKSLLDKREAVLELMEDLTFRGIARQVGTKPNVIHAIDQGRTYKHIGEMD